MFFLKSNFKKIGTLVIIFCLVFVPSFFVKTQRAEAGADIVFDPTNLIENAITAIETAAIAVSAYALELKEYVGDSLFFAAKQAIVQQVVADTVNWINAGFPDGGPAYITSFDSFLIDAGDKVIGEYIGGSKLNFLCSPFSIDVQIALEQTFAGRKSYECTLSEVFDNTVNAYEDMGNGWNWDTWAEMTQNPYGNAYGSFIDASIRINADINAEQSQLTREIDWGSGFRPLKKCDNVEYYDEGTNETMVEEVCQNVTPGDAIASSLNKSLGAGQDALISADEINEIIGALFGQLLKQVMSDDGLYGSYEKGYFDGVANEDVVGSGNTGVDGVIEQTKNMIQRDIDKEQKYLDIKKETLRILKGMKSALNGLATSCPASKDWVDSTIASKIDRPIARIEKEIKESQDLIDKLQKLIDRLDDLLAGGDGVVPPDEPDPTPDPDDDATIPPTNPLASYTCEKVISPANTKGFFSLISFNSQLLAGAFGYGLENQSMMFGLNGRVSPGITGIDESVCVMRNFNGAIYANTEMQSLVYKSTNGGKNWVMVKDLDQPTGCGLVVHDGYLYAVGANGFAGQRKSVISRTSDGTNWFTVFTKDGVYIRDLISYNGKIYAFGTDNNSKAVMFTSSSGAGVGNWSTTNLTDRYFRASVINSTLWVGSSMKYSDSGKSGIFRSRDGETFENVYSTTNYDHITYVRGFDGMLFAGTTKGFKNNSKTGALAKGPTQLLVSVNGGGTWNTACTVQEEGIWDMLVIDEKLYISTVSFNNTTGGSVYEVKKR
ncbi:MAG: hypothetical protein A3B83_05010 [Candidatus Magasanikbacteria bacterium RIFCSPHIGHO2_02_FULL_33_17]|nr:MAG: hypothetical protein A3B83_05010 [Candidatus Magasanikbacteria bacterium RIFCSPHIGHO2_02_FULL_33_17]